MSFKKWVIGTAASIAAIPSALAHCPVCTAATGVAVGIGRVYGVDDTIMGVLIGGFAISTGLWANNALVKRKYHLFPGQGAALVALSLVLTIVGLKTGNLLAGAILWGMPRLLAGMLVGSAATIAGHGVHEYARSLNNGKNHIALQGMSIMLASILAAALLFAGGLL